MSCHNPRAADLRFWAGGNLALEASVELIICAVDGRLLRGPWIRNDGELHSWFDPDVAAAEGGSLSGGERRVLAIATTLASADHPVDLGDAVTGIDPDALGIVLASMAHAGGVAVPFDGSGRAHDEPC